MSSPLSYEEYLERNGSLTYTNVGTSMMPLLREGKDLFILRKKGTQRCAVGDVVLFRRPPNRYVLHRVVEVRPKDYVMMGDNCLSREHGVRDEDILGVMTGYVRDGSTHSTDELGYRLYSAFVLHTAGVRVAAKRCRAALARRVKAWTHGA